MSKFKLGRNKDTKFPGIWIIQVGHAVYEVDSEEFEDVLYTISKFHIGRTTKESCLQCRLTLRCAFRNQFLIAIAKFSVDEISGGHKPPFEFLNQWNSFNSAAPTAISAPRISRAPRMPQNRTRC